MIKKFLITVFSLLLLSATPVVYASGHGEEEPSEEEQAPAEPEIGYYELKPDLTTNLATMNPHDKIHYVRIKMTLMLLDSRDETIIAEVEPLIKDTIVSILGSKEFTQIASNDNREKIRTECRDKIISILNDKFGKPIINDLLFLSYMYQ